MACLENIAKDPMFITGLATKVILLIFHISVLACILRQRARGVSSFRSGFFTIYVIQSAADLFCHISETVMFRLPPVGCVSQHMYDFPQGNLLFTAATYSLCVQFAAHAAIGINRFLVLTDAWTARKERLAVAAILLVSMPTAAVKFFGRVTFIETNIPGAYSVARDVPWISFASSLLYYVVTSVVTLVYEMRSLIRYKRLTATAREKYRNDFLLLVYALLQFSLQLTTTVCYGLFAIGALIVDLRLVSVGLFILQFNSAVLCLSPPLCLLSTSKLLRRAWWKMYCPFAKRSEMMVSSSPVVRIKPEAATTPN